MAAHSGEPAREDGTFHCQRCNNRMRVNKGQAIPKCLDGGNDGYYERTNESSGR